MVGLASQINRIPLCKIAYSVGPTHSCESSLVYVLLFLLSHATHSLLIL